jgi:tetratricopeptide (TPR) repeat protein
MRSHALHRSILVLVMALVVGSGARAWADDPRVEARTHYQAGQKAYAAADYKAAIKEFSAAQQIMPADLNNYNLALCYDKLGDAEPAIQYYKEYLNKVPNADKRSEIEASIARLDAAVKSAQAKKADEAKKADDARKADEAKKQAEADARKADDANKAGAGAGVAAGAGAGAGAAVGAGAQAGATAAGAGASAGVAGGAAVGGGSTGVPSNGTTVATGDAQLDRVATVDINSIRDQRLGAGGGVADNRGAPPPAGVSGTAGMNGAPPPPANGTAAAATNGAPPPPAQGNAVGAPADKPAQETPVYKKWWFWVVVGVSAYVLYEIANDNSMQPGAKAHEQPLGPTSVARPGGFTILRF